MPALLSFLNETCEIAEELEHVRNLDFIRSVHAYFLIADWLHDSQGSDVVEGC